MKVGTVIKYVLIVLLLAALLFPFLVMAASSFKPYKEILSSKVTFLPKRI